ncbi:MAG: hypothetical protein ACK2TV_06860 [Anaerolineales bacterium]|jgi:hypothetical protein
MQKNHETYTYTARNASDPDKVVTFTLYDGHLRVNLTGLLDRVSTVASSEEKSDEIKRQLKLQTRPALLKLKEGISGPIHIGDVKANLEEEQLMVTMWPRVAGLRLAPVRVDMGQIDNEDAAEAFVEELQHRKEEVESDARRFFGPLDYWIGWIGLLLLVGIFIRRPKHNES